MEKTILPYLNEIRIPSKSTKVFKDECCFSFETPVNVFFFTEKMTNRIFKIKTSEGGLYVDLNSFLGFSKDYVKLNFERTGHHLYLHIKQILKKKEEPQEEKNNETKKKPSIMAIGVEGGFEVDERKNIEIEERFSVVSLPDFVSYPFPDPQLPKQIQDCINAIIAADSASKQEQIQQWVEQRQVSIHALELKQLDNGVKIPPKGWKCQKCDLTENLWLNLTDGAILCGRKNWDGTGGNGHALEHYKTTSFPLCVKLGTITPDGQAGDLFFFNKIFFKTYLILL